MYEQQINRTVMTSSVIINEETADEKTWWISALKRR